MSLTMGRAPFGHAPAGRFNFEVPDGEVIYVDPSPRRVRAFLGGEAVLDSTRAKMLHRQGYLCRYFVPRDDVRWDALGEVKPIEPPEGAPGLDGHVSFEFDAMERWLEEDDEIISHAPDPYHAVDVRNSSRRVRILFNGEPIAESTRAKVIFETSLPPRWYLPREDVLVDLEPSEIRTTCAYKGHAGYLSAPSLGEEGENIAWYYPDPRHAVEHVRDLVCFFNERVDIELDGEVQERPMTPWSRLGWWRGYGEER